MLDYKLLGRYIDDPVAAFDAETTTPAPTPMTGRAAPAEGDGTEATEAARPAEPPDLSPDDIEELARAHENNPDAVFRLIRGRTPEDVPLTPASLAAAIESLQRQYAHPELALEIHRATARLSFESAVDIGWQHPHPNPQCPAIRPDSTKFEDGNSWVVDAWKWKSWLPKAIGGALQGKPKFVWHSGDQFTYPLPSGDGKTSRLALMADWGTGLYHSWYIVSEIARLAPAADAVFHLGDVYYAGTYDEVLNNLARPLGLLGMQIPTFLINGNHEMDGSGRAFFAELHRRHEAKLTPQRGSYFALDGGRFRVIGIDTDYHDKGRHNNRTLNAWLNDQLEAGRAKGQYNIVLSQHYPYGLRAKKTRKLYKKDIGPLAQRGLIDLWFWGDTHHCALYNRVDPETPFIGSCIGHGGFPYVAKYEFDKDGNLSKPYRKITKSKWDPVWLETGTRFPYEKNIRRDRGNNGYVVLDLRQDGDKPIGLTYRDWKDSKRCWAELAGAPGDLQIKACEALQGCYHLS